MVQRRREVASESKSQNERYPIYVSIYQISSLKRHEDDKRTFRKEKKLTFRRIKKNELRISERENREEEEEKKEEEKTRLNRIVLRQIYVITCRSTWENPREFRKAGEHLKAMGQCR